MQTLQHMWNIALSRPGMAAGSLCFNLRNLKRLKKIWLKIVLATPLQYLNIKLTDISVTDPEKYPHMVSTIYLFLLFFFHSPPFSVLLEIIENIFPC